jgi:glycosyltransferase involved in cell wall biosynthesis
MFCTTIIPTVGRTTLGRAVQSVLNQNFSHDEYEVIVVNDSGLPLPAEDWQNSPLVRVVNTNRRERCIARNVGAALANGKYLHFLDDDDWLLPDALENLWKLAQAHPQGAWLYGGTVVYDREDRPVIQLIHSLESNCFVHTMAGEWVPLQASFIHHAKFHLVGGFNPFIPGAEDIDLTRKMALRFDFVGTPELLAGVEFGSLGSTTNRAKALLAGRDAREQILEESGVSERLWQSATTAYWRGRIVRLYWTSAVWSFMHRKLLRALGRLLFGFAALLRSAPTSLLSRDFWKAILGPHKGEAFLRGYKERQNVVGILE